MDDLAATLRPIPAELARVAAELEKLNETVNHLIEDNREIRAELAALHRQIAQIGWGLSGALVGILIALIVAVV